MGDAQLLPPSTGTFTPATPSGLTPNTRTEAEAALTQNSLQQTESAAPTTAMGEDDTVNEAQKAYRRPQGPIRTSSTNYEKALQEARKQSSVSSDLSLSTTKTGESGTGPSPMTDGATVSSPPPLANIDPRQGVVPLNPGIGAGQQEAVKKARGRGLSLGMLGRQQSWSEQDMKHVYRAGWMGEVKGEGVATGYESRREE